MLSIDISNVLSGFDNLRKLFSAAKITVENKSPIIKKSLSVSRLSDDFFMGDLDVGCTVKVSGVLSKYTLCLTPSTYSGNIIKDHDIKNFPFIRGGGKQVVARASLTVGGFHHPIQTIPPFFDESGNVFYIMFLYPSDHDTFLFDEFDKDDDTGLVFPEISPHHQGIPVLTTKDVYDRFSEKRVNLSCPIKKIEGSYASLLINDASYKERVFWNFYRENELKHGFFLCCDDICTFSIDKVEDIRSMPAVIYSEGHFENINYSEEREFISRNMPMSEKISHGNSFKVSMNENKNINHLNESKIKVISTNNGSFGFYSITDLASRDSYRHALKNLSDYYNKFRVTTTNEIRKKTSCDAKFAMDCLFDFSKYGNFGVNNIHRSNELHKVFMEDKKYKEISNWLCERSR